MMEAKTRASFIPPMLLLNTQTLPEGRDWLYELKLDGYRALALKTGRKVQLQSRKDNDFTLRYPHIAKALAPLPNETVIDGELVALDAKYFPQHRLRTTSESGGGRRHHTRNQTRISAAGSVRAAATKR
jgi:ATP-dependent DNA ligase